MLSSLFTENPYYPAENRTTAEFLQHLQQFPSSTSAQDSLLKFCHKNKETIGDLPPNGKALQELTSKIPNYVCAFDITALQLY